MNRKEKIYGFISSKEYIPLQFDELSVVLGVPEEDRNEFKTVLDELCFEGKIFVTKKNKYMATKASNSLVSGRINCVSKGFFAFLIPDDKDEEEVFIHGDKLGTALHSDRVLVTLYEKSTGDRREGYVTAILQRGNDAVIGVIAKERNGYFILHSDNPKIYKNILISRDRMHGAQIGDRVSAQITKYSENGNLYGEVTMILGDSESLEGCIEGIILQHKIKQEFDDDTLREAAKVEEKILEEDLKDRTDYRDLLTFTIDGDNAKDFDDAVSLQMSNNGNYILGVHIADVTHYVKKGSALDKEAFERGTSVYLADRVIPMLPEKLSNGICSLNPNADRLTLSVTMEIDSSGQVVSHKIEKAIINSKYRMTYNNVSAILEGDEALRDEYKEIVPTIEKMSKLAKILNDKRDKRGAIQFDFPETGVICNEWGRPVDIVRLERGISNKIIEEFMLITNETVAEYAYWSELPFVYRTHEAPSEEKITSFNNFIRPFGKQIKGRFDEENPVHPKELQKILEEFLNTPEERMVSMTMLRSLMKAEYKTENLGHFGLAATYYCHFTSPIRRYPDLAIHRILKSFITGKMTNEIRGNFASFAQDASQHSSETEVEAEYAERDVDDLMKAAYMKSHLGESFEGIITHITGFGMFVELSNSVEGLVRLENMTDDYYNYSEEDFALIGERTNRIYRIGDEVCVTVMRSDIVSRQIDFVLSDNVSKRIISKFETMDKRSLSPRSIVNEKRRLKQKSSNNRRKFVKKKR